MINIEDREINDIPFKDILDYLEIPYKEGKKFITCEINLQHFDMSKKYNLFKISKNANGTVSVFLFLLYFCPEFKNKVRDLLPEFFREVEVIKGLMEMDEETMRSRKDCDHHYSKYDVYDIMANHTFSI